MTLQERFCKQFRCDRTDFIAVALKKFMHRPWNRLAPLIARAKPGALATECQIIEQLGRVTSGKGLSTEIRDLRSNYFRHPDFGFVRKILRFRLSGRRIARACGDFWSVDDEY